jgi:hypothetical protein
MAVFKRRRDSIGFGWPMVDPALMYAALASAMENDIAIMLSRAAGGRGVCVRLMKGRTEQPEVEYAFDAEELNALFELIIDAYSSKSEDAVMTIRAAMAAPSKRLSRATAAKSLENAAD